MRAIICILFFSSCITVNHYHYDCRQPDMKEKPYIQWGYIERELPYYGDMGINLPSITPLPNINGWMNIPMLIDTSINHIDVHPIGGFIIKQND